MNRLRFLRYLNVFTLPVTVYLSFTGHGWVTFAPFLVFFIAAPMIELCFAPVSKNLEGDQKKEVSNAHEYDIMLYLALPIQYIFLWLFFGATLREGLTTMELVGMTVAMGIMCGVLGINVGHELGHRNNRLEQLVGELLLLTSLNTHFLPYHNFCHHKNVATPDDPATARKGEWMHAFVLRSNFSSYLQAWKIEAKNLKMKGKSVISIHNRMIVYLLAQLALVTLVYFQFGTATLLAFLGAAIIGVSLLETVNYIEHYGLLRKQKENGVYEQVRTWHSWNSDHMVSRVLLFELSRHSDHHYKANKKYQLLDSHGSQSPQMPTGYMGMMWLAWFPPLWFWIMNPKVERAREAY